MTCTHYDIIHAVLMDVAVYQQEEGPTRYLLQNDDVIPWFRETESEVEMSTSKR